MGHQFLVLQVQHLLSGCFPELVPPPFFNGLGRESRKRETIWEKGLGDAWLLLPESQHPELLSGGQKPAREAQGTWMCGAKTSGNRSAGNKSQRAQGRHGEWRGVSIGEKASVPPACGIEI